MFRLILDNVGVSIHQSDGHVRWLVQSVTLQCQATERIGLIGRNGSGKTTLARVIGGLQKPSVGRRIIQPSHSRALLVLQRPEDFFVRESVARQIAGYAPRQLSPQRIGELLVSVGLAPELAGQSPHYLSGGQQRLVAIACALAAEATFIVLDEPLAGLDSQNRQLVIQALRQLNEVGLLIISHYPDDLLSLVERLWVLDDGQLLYDGPFTQAPTTILSICLSPYDPSLYYALRRLEERNVRVPTLAYSQLNMENTGRQLAEEK